MWLWALYLLLGLVGVVGLAWLLIPWAKYWLRAILFYSCILLSSLFAIPFCAPYRPHPDNTKIVAWFLRRLCRWMDLRCEFRGFEHVNFEGPGVIIMNHQSAIDILVTFLGSDVPPGLVPIIKRELFLMGPFGLSCWLNGAIGVVRSDPKQSHAAVNDAVQRTKDENLKVLVFPEGTRYHQGYDFLPFKKGGFHLAVQGQIPIIPMVVSSYRNFYSKPQRKFITGGEVIVQVLPSISTEGLTKDDVTKLSEDTRTSMLSVFTAISSEAEERFNSKKDL